MGSIKTARCSILAAAVAIVAAALLVWSMCDSAPSKESSRRPRIERRAHHDKSARESVREAMSGYKGKREVSKGPARKIGDLFGHLKGVDRRDAEAIQNALDDNDLGRVVAAADKAGNSGNPEVRKLAVEALGWFGAEALPELTPFLADADEEVADAAADQWQIGLTQIDDDEIRIATAEAAMRTIGHEDALRQIVSEITAQDDDLKVMQALVDIIDSENRVGAEIAKEEYETLTGKPWSGIDAAESWLEENYTPENQEE